MVQPFGKYIEPNVADICYTGVESQILSLINSTKESK